MPWESGMPPVVGADEQVVAGDAANIDTELLCTECERWLRAADGCDNTAPPRSLMTAQSTSPADVSALRTFVAQVQHLPLFSATAAQLIDSMNREDTTTGELSRIVSSDAALVTQLLRMVNSPFYGLARRIGSVSEAFAVLGLDLVRRTVTAAVLQRPLFAYLHDTSIARAFWRHELLCGALARHIARRAGAEGELAFVAGLLHDVGRLAMLIHFPEHTEILLGRRSGDVEHGIDLETELFGFTHAEVGAALLELWGLPDTLVLSAHQHIDQVEPDDVLSAAVWRANLLTHEMEDEDDADEVQPWMEAIGLTVAARHRMMDEIEALEGEPA
jgi:putative nucleotidyltransferase with HDIG domain